jgi:probable phosphoglycerate mutase
VGSFAAIHHSPLRRATQTAKVIAGYLPHVPQHACDLVADRTPVPPPGQKSQYPDRYWSWLDGVPEQERDEGGVAIQAAIEHLGNPGTEDRRELVITHNFVIGWFVRHVLDAPVWRWMGLNQANCGLTIVQWDDDRPPTLVSFNDVGHLGQLASV